MFEINQSEFLSFCSQKNIDAPVECQYCADIKPIVCEILRPLFSVTEDKLIQLIKEIYYQRQCQLFFIHIILTRLLMGRNLWLATGEQPESLNVTVLLLYT